MTKKQTFEEVMADSMVEVRVELYQPFYDFIKEYMAFFGIKDSKIEDVCREMIYHCVEDLYQNLEEFALKQCVHHGSSFFRKWPHIATTSFSKQEPEP